MLLAASHSAWVAADTRPPPWDHALHLEAALRCARAFRDGDWGRILALSTYYPPLGHCAAGLLHRLAGASAFAALAVTQAALALAVFATYRIGVRLTSIAAGLAAGLLFAGYAEVVLASRVFLLDLPLTALVAASVLVLLRTDGFTRRGWSLLAGAVAGLGLLTKSTYPIYVGPIAAAIWLTAPPGAPRGLRARHVALALALALAIAAPWYLRHIRLPVSLLRLAFATGAAEGDPVVGTVEGWTWYLRALPPQLGVPFAVLFAAAGAWAVAARPRGLGLLATWLVAPALVFTLLRNKDFRYTLPCLPAVALLSVAWLGRLPRRRAAVAAGVIALAVGAQMAYLGWGWPAPAWARGRMERRLLFPSFPPVTERWPIVEILDRVAADRAGNPRHVTLAVVPNVIFFSPGTFAYYATRDERPVQVTKAWSGAPRFVDYVVTKSGDQGPEHTTAAARAVMARLDARDPGLAPLLTPVAAYPLPDDSRATLYRVRPAAVTGVPAAVLLARAAADAPRALAWGVRDPQGLALDVEPYSDAETLAGRVRRLTVRADAARIGDFARRPVGLRVHDAVVTLEDVRLDPHALATRGALELLGARRLVVHRAVVFEADLAEALAAAVPWLAQPAVAIDDGRLALDGGVAGLRFRLAVRPEIVPASLGVRVRVEHARLARLPLPAGALNLALALVDPVVRFRELPLEIIPPRVSLAGGALRLEAAAP